MEPSAVELIGKLQSLGTTSLLLLVLIGGFRQWWCWGWQLRTMQEDRDFWRDAALRSTSLAEDLKETALHARMHSRGSVSGRAEAP